MNNELRLARAYLSRVAEPPAPGLAALVDRVGPLEAARRVRLGEVQPDVAAETSARRENDMAAADLEAAAAVGARLVIPEDEEWPSWPLLSLSNAFNRGLRWAAPPLALWVRGSPSLGDSLDRSVAIVGARAATAYGEHVASDFGQGIALAGMTVVSGAAFGIDAAAHRGALSARGRTIAVLGCGIDIAYPMAHARLLEHIADRGLVVSEYPPGVSAAKHRFLVRNRLIAALTAGTVVVEAGRRSGSRNTASTAGSLGKRVLVVPGPVTSAQSVGCHALLRAQAADLVESTADVLEAVGAVGEFAAEPASSPKRATDGLGDEALRVHDALRARKELGETAVAADAGVPLDRTRALLTDLEITGLAIRGDSGWRRA
ncbi:DNA-processing protein DprA [Actinokineospora fastidiosa]|uniref:DNA processing protein DprA n=1 Tax=Actinokineospora fastidiosa TaxID=1816 RepID=A0A918GTU5_9PSEU|nr:DNA-processing protein DprA [Actinokineospora fastidiosa]GGS61288.1 DNA processing protein DprA [Actinokineospora fastidiosa]